MNLTSKHEIVTEDEEIDINVDDDDPFDKSFDADSDINKFSFSISNILSDSFGPKPVKIEPNQMDKSIFRPFEVQKYISNNSDSINSMNVKPIVQNPSSIFLSNFRLSEIFNYSTKNASSQSKSDSNLRKSMASYPKIHEEILNSHKKNPNILPASSFFSTTSKIPPLGGLCKTISQIGQENVTKSTLSSTAPLVQSKSMDSLQIQQSSTSDASVDSDDCTSEASTSKDESQKMWPAWVSFIATSHACSLEIDLLCFSLLFRQQIFCTRYSDRPSSGEFT